MPSILAPKSPLARLFLGVGLLGTTASVLLTWAILKLARGGPIDVGIAIAATVLLAAQVFPVSGVLAWTKLQDEKRAFAVERSRWLPVAGLAGVVALGFFATPTIGVVAGVFATSMFLSTRLARGHRGWIIAWVLLSVPVLLADVGAAWAYWWWTH